MKKYTKNYLLILGFTILGVILINLIPKNKYVDWTRSYDISGKNPYDLYIFNHEIDSFFDQPVLRFGKTPYEYFQENDSIKIENYFFFNEYLDKTSEEELLEKVADGSYLFLANTYLDTLDLQTNYINADYISLTALNEKANTFFKLSKEDLLEYISKIPHKKPSKALGYVHKDDKKFVNFIEVSFGKGKIFYLSSEVVFTNYYLKDENCKEFVEIAMAYLPRNKRTIWFDSDFNKGEVYVSASPDFFDESSERKGKKMRHQRNILDFIFKNPPLAWGWRILLFGFLLYLIFQGKRRQRIIPIIEKLKNTTIEFAQTIGNLYFQEGNPANLFQKKIIYFLDTIRQQYYLETNKLDDEFIRKLHQKSTKEISLIQEIISQIHSFEKTKNCTENELIKFDDLIYQFFKTEKK